MLKKYITLLLFVSTIVNNAWAQGTNDKISFQSISSLGLLNGSTGTAVSIQTIFGAAYKKTFLGLGAGLDYYRFRTIPLFVDVRHEFGKGERNMFLYADIGYNQDWVAKDNNNQVYTYGLPTNYSGGLYYDAGIGYKFGFTKNDALLFSAGYSSKRLTSKVGTGVCPLIGPCYNAIQTYQYYLSRLVLKASWKF